MYETEINNLGLNLLIRLYRAFEFLGFLGGETQRPILNNQNVIVTARDCYCLLHLDFKYKYAREVYLTSGKWLNSAHKSLSIYEGSQLIYKKRIQNIDEYLK